ncbi:hypothetical protein CBR_g31610 [Chara braunii]|uniref:Myb-like domain-containing protein n=1 Tax=Chara braunii TaxID=69332 RepID=A0A388LFH1_CHABU|nr:hypothetical protein CBR_g31610 [Chara braunii]|eukprot:GBG81054.1 hypothetical protein CBR_g31610 [Chara braunii]
MESTRWTGDVEVRSDGSTDMHVGRVHARPHSRVPSMHSFVAVRQSTPAVQRQYFPSRAPSQSLPFDRGCGRQSPERLHAGLLRGCPPAVDMWDDGGFAVDDHSFSVQQQCDLYAARACIEVTSMGAGFGMPAAGAQNMDMGGTPWSPQCTQSTVRSFGMRCSPSPQLGVHTDGPGYRTNTRPVSLETRMDSPYDEGTVVSGGAGEDIHAEHESVVPVMARSMGEQGDAQGRGAEGGEGSRRLANARPSAQKKQSVPWTLDERAKLAFVMGEDDALMADANGQHRFK